MGTNWLDPSSFQGTIITDVTDPEQVRAAVRDYKVALLCVLDQILRRYEARPAYRFIDTKLSLVTGRDFRDDDPIRGRNTIYGWIQGRGLEALAGHALWIGQDRDLDDRLRDNLTRRIRNTMAGVLQQMEQLRAANGGRLSFMMTPEGRPLKVTDDGRVVPAELPPDLPTSVSDMFYCKGMALASFVLGDKHTLQQACNLFHQVYNDVVTGRYYSDQQAMDPRNPVRPVPGRFGHGSRMIGIGAAATFLQCTGDPAYTAVGLEFIDYVLSRHVNITRPFAVGQPYDMWEFNDAQGKPFIEDGGILRSDSGHATEFVGLALKLIALSEQRCTTTEAELPKILFFKHHLPGVLKQNFENGFSHRGFGMFKAVDLSSRNPLNDQMPWWNLPETMRGAVEAMRISDEKEQLELAELAAHCSNAFIGHFIKKKLGLMAVQTIDADGHTVDVIPATPDADPAYHTGLSLIDCVSALDEL